MIQKPAVFISSTGDLRSARDLVAKVLYSMGYEPVWQDIEPTDGGALLDVLRDRMRPCVMMIQLVGRRYGAEPPEHVRSAEFGRCSYSQFEALYFEQTLKRKVIYHFLDPAFPTDPAPAEPAEFTALQEVYRARIQQANRLRHDHIATNQELELSVRRLRDELASLRQQTDARYRKMIGLTAATVAGVGVVALLGAIGLGLLRQGQSVQTTQIEQQTTKIVDQAEQLARIEKLLSEQKLGNPQGVPTLSQADQDLLERVKKVGDLHSRAAASVLQPDSGTDALLAELQARQDAAAFDLAILQAKRWYFDKLPQYDKAIPFFEQAIEIRPDAYVVRHYAAVAHTQARLGDRGAHQKRAMEIEEGTLQRVPPGSEHWGAAHWTLGNAWLGMATADRSENVKKAVSHYESALTLYKRESHPGEWATLQMNLGTAWQELTTGDRNENLKNAIACYEAALTARTREANPEDWAGIQQNLGNAWQRLLKGDQTENLKKAIACYEAALTIRTREAAPANWAAIQNNLGAAWSSMPTGDRGESMRRAIACFEAALTITTREANPADWAMTQVNLGNLWSEMPDGDRNENFRRAITYFEAGLTVRTRSTQPVAWAFTKNGVAIAYIGLASDDETATKAVEAARDALTVFTREAFPLEFAAVHDTLGAALSKLDGGHRKENLLKALEAFDVALSYLKKDQFPELWAEAQWDLGLALAQLAEQPGEDRCDRLRHAIACDKGVLTVYTVQAFPSKNAEKAKILATHRQAYESNGCAAEVPFDQVPAVK